MGHWEFPGSPVVTSTAGDTGSITSQGFPTTSSKAAPPPQKYASLLATTMIFPLQKS